MPPRCSWLGRLGIRWRMVRHSASSRSRSQITIGIWCCSISEIASLQDAGGIQGPAAVAGDLLEERLFVRGIPGQEDQFHGRLGLSPRLVRASPGTMAEINHRLPQSPDLVLQCAPLRLVFVLGAGGGDLRGSEVAGLSLAQFDNRTQADS